MSCLDGAGLAADS